MKWIVNIGFITDKKSFEVGDILDESQVPKKSKKWLVEQNIIEKYDENKFKKEEEE